MLTQQQHSKGYSNNMLSGLGPMKKESLLVAFVATCLILAFCNLNVTEAKSCHLRELDLCLASVLVFAQAPVNSKVTENDINKQCHYFGDTESCFRNYTLSCSSKTQRALIDFASDGVIKTFKDYCTPGSSMRKSFIKHGECLNNLRTKTNKCLIDFQAAIERTTTADSSRWRDRPHMLCCSYDRYRHCLTDVVEPICGHDAVELGEIFVKSLFSRAFTVTCQRKQFFSTLMIPQNEIDVLVADNTAVDLDLYQYWLDGYSVDESAKFVLLKEAEFFKNFNQLLLTSDIQHQYRTFALIEKLLPSPTKLSEDWTFRMAEQTKRTLVEKFYDFDDAVIRLILNKKLSARSRKSLDDVSRKSNKSLKSCRRQFDNFKRIYKTVDGLSGDMVTNIQNHFLLSERLARKYADYMCYNRFEVSKRRPFKGWSIIFKT